MSVRAEIAQAAREAVLKRRLESKMLSDITPLFSRMATQFKVSVAGTGAVPGQAVMDASLSDWRSVLLRHYERVQKAFAGMVEIEQRIKQEGDDEIGEDDLLEALLLWRTMASERSAKNITSTNEKNMRDALNEAHAELMREGKPTDNRSVAVLGLAILKRKFKGRTGTITMFETQQAAENAKFSEAEVLSGVRPSETERRPPILPIPTTKVWRNMGDDRVRPSPLYPRQDPRFNHRIPDGQKRNIYAPFDVSGEKLMYPGDVSLGASPQNVLGCRCASIYRVTRPNL